MLVASSSPIRTKKSPKASRMQSFDEIGEEIEEEVDLCRHDADEVEYIIDESGDGEPQPAAAGQADEVFEVEEDLRQSTAISPRPASGPQPLNERFTHLGTPATTLTRHTASSGSTGVHPRQAYLVSKKSSTPPQSIGIAARIERKRAIEAKQPTLLGSPPKTAEHMAQRHNACAEWLGAVDENPLRIESVDCNPLTLEKFFNNKVEMCGINLNDTVPTSEQAELVEQLMHICDFSAKEVGKAFGICGRTFTYNKLMQTLATIAE
eukprot:TRINITY_DN77757_c0_g1_i1.p1 TRINITY_DN77757_c0_g1~~TRINITY_DN77757_c0_g1_i1.p1  ORF type:complete len:265 (-),score=18.08 TRINITY_DN77757_c0_g1_i1:34-828(-)